MASPAHKESIVTPPTTVEKRQESVEYVIHSMRLEGVDLDQQSLDNFAAYGEGKISDDEFIKRGLEIAFAKQKINQKNG